MCAFFFLCLSCQAEERHTSNNLPETGAQNVYNQTARLPQSQFRAVWVATVKNMDWPSKPGLSIAQQMKEAIAYLDKAVELNLNAIIFQVRPHGDAFINLLLNHGVTTYPVKKVETLATTPYSSGLLKHINVVWSYMPGLIRFV